jgi:integrase
MFKSVFAEKFDAMLEFRTARGFKAEAYHGRLLKFDRYCVAGSVAEPMLTQDLVFDWLDSNAALSNLPSNATAIRQFGKYLCAIGDDAYVLPEKFAGHKNTKPPYIFTDAELTVLFAEIDRLPATDNEPFLNEMVPTLFRLTYTCGLRPNEGRELLKENVNLNTGEVLIVRTKQKKERLVVMSDDMLAMCREYNARRNIFGSSNPCFFPANEGGALASARVYATFNKAWNAAVRVTGNPRPQAVRVYDLRHRFASACLNRWLDEGENLMVMLPYLRTYMGHNTLDETAYYIHILPENLVKSPGVDWNALNAILPEVSACPD